jgi:alginate O-acetyltransferase complex protein AlgI
VSLSTWLRDYLYVPLGGNRGGAVPTCRNLLLTMVLAGLWHGAAWNFVLFGFYHGVILCVEYVWRRWRPRPEERPAGWSRAWRTLATFHLLCVGFVIFRVHHVADASLALERIVTWAAAESTEIYARERGLWILLLAVGTHFWPRRWLEQGAHWLTERCPPMLQGGLVVVVLGVVAVAYSAHHPFIYFQF